MCKGKYVPVFTHYPYDVPVLVRPTINLSPPTNTLRYVYTGRDKQRDMLQRDLLRGNNVYMVGSCRARLLHIIHVLAVFGVGVL